MKKILSFLLIFTMLASFTTPMYAKEKANKSLKRIMGYKHKCNITFIIKDETKDGYPGKSFKAVMKDKKGKTKDEYDLSFLNSWGKDRTPKYTVKAPIEYLVTFEGIKEGYKMVDTKTKSDDIKFKAESKGEVDCRWSIVDDEEVAAKVKKDTEKKETKENVSDKKADKSNESNDSDEAQINKIAEALTADNSSEKNEQVNKVAAGNNDISLSNEDAKKVYDEFYNDVKYIKDDKEWENALLLQYKLFANTYVEWFEKFVKGGTKEKFLEMSLFDRFIWAETYLTFAWAVNAGKFDTYYGNEKNFETHITSNVVNMMESAKDHDKVVKAYLKLAKWQYEYVRQNGGPFNFINNRTYFEEISTDEDSNTDNAVSSSKNSEVPEVNEKSEVLDSNGLSDKDKKEMEEAANELLKSADDKTKEEVKKKGIWDDFLTALSGNIITIVIIIVLAVALAIVVWKRKALGVEDDSSDSGVEDTHNK